MRNLIILMIMKKILVSMFTLVLLLAGCSSSNGAIKVTLVQNKGEIQTGLTELATEYNESQDQYYVEILPVANDPGAMKAQIASSEAPTIFTTNGYAQFQQYKEYMATIPNDYSLLSQALEGSTTMLEEDGNLYGLPAWIEGFAYVVNDSILEEAGVTKEDLQSVAGFTEACGKIEAKGYECINIPDEPYFIGGQPMNTPLALVDDYQGFISEVKSGNAKFEDQPEFQEWVQFLEMQRDNSNPVLGSTYDDSTNAFATGQAAIIFQGNWVESILATYDIDFDYSFVPMAINGNDSISSYVAVNWHINKDRSQEEQAGALDFLNWLYTDSDSQSKIATEFGVVAPYEGFDTSLYGPLSKEVYEYYAAGKGLPLAISYLPEGYIDNQLNSLVQKFYDGQYTGDELLAEITKSLVE